jgi:hypothetical protein
MGRSPKENLYSNDKDERDSQGLDETLATSKRLIEELKALIETSQRLIDEHRAIADHRKRDAAKRKK